MRNAGDSSGVRQNPDPNFLRPVSNRWATDAAKLGYADYRYGIVMPQGDRDLAVVALKERLDIPDVREIMLQQARNLEYIHSQRLVHADIKLLVSDLFPMTATH